MMKKSGKKNFMASVNDGYVGRIDEVADRLREKGCEIVQVLKITGVITGKVDYNTQLKDLEIEGIQSVEIQKKIKKI